MKSKMLKDEEWVRTRWKNLRAANTYYPGTAWEIFFYVAKDFLEDKDGWKSGSCARIKTITGVNLKDAWKNARKWLEQRLRKFSDLESMMIEVDNSCELLVRTKNSLKEIIQEKIDAIKEGLIL